MVFPTAKNAKIAKTIAKDVAGMNPSHHPKNLLGGETEVMSRIRSLLKKRCRWNLVGLRAFGMVR